MLHRSRHIEGKENQDVLLFAHLEETEHRTPASKVGFLITTDISTFPPLQAHSLSLQQMWLPISSEIFMTFYIMVEGSETIRKLRRIDTREACNCIVLI